MWSGKFDFYQGKLGEFLKLVPVTTMHYHFLVFQMYCNIMFMHITQFLLRLYSTDFANLLGSGTLANKSSMKVCCVVSCVPRF